MRVLVVGDPSKLAERVLKTLSKVLRDLKYTETLDQEVEVTFRQLTGTLIDYLYIPDASGVQKQPYQAQKKFELIDLIIMVTEMSTQQAPWCLSLDEARWLVKKAMAEGKPLVAIGVTASQIVAFVSQVKEACQVPWETCVDVKKWKYEERGVEKRGLIELASGNYYIINELTKEITLRGKVGLSHQQSVTKKKQFDLAISRFVLKLATTERLAIIRKLHFNHPSVSGVNQSFKVQVQPSPWSVEERFTTIVEEHLTRQPLAFEVTPNAFCMQFEITYDESLQILENVLRHKILKLFHPFQQQSVQQSRNLLDLDTTSYSLTSMKLRLSHYRQTLHTYSSQQRSRRQLDPIATQSVMRVSLDSHKSLRTTSSIERPDNQDYQQALAQPQKKSIIRINLKTPTERYMQEYREKQRQKQGQKEEEGTRNGRMNMTLSEKLFKEGYREPIDKTKWVTGNDFMTRVGIATTGKGFSPTSNSYVARDPSEPPVLYRFRQKSPQRWLGGDFKKS